jgi:hypothetical protein
VSESVSVAACIATPAAQYRVHPHATQPNIGKRADRDRAANGFLFPFPNQAFHASLLLPFGRRIALAKDGSASVAAGGHN